MTNRERHEAEAYEALEKWLQKHDPECKMTDVEAADAFAKNDDVLNKYSVGLRGDGKIVIINPPDEMSKTDALMFAAWIVAMADDDDTGFQKALEAIRLKARRYGSAK